MIQALKTRWDRNVERGDAKGPKNTPERLRLWRWLAPLVFLAYVAMAVIALQLPNLMPSDHDWATWDSIFRWVILTAASIIGTYMLYGSIFTKRSLDNAERKRLARIAKREAK